MFKKLSVMFYLVVAAMVIAAPDPLADLSGALTDLVSDIIPVAVTVISAVLGIAGGILLVRAGIKWLRSMMG